jgi:hypothetical protein
MIHASLDNFLGSVQARELAPGPVAIIFAEDDVGVDSSLRHHARLGFGNILLLGRSDLQVPPDCADLCHLILADPEALLPQEDSLNRLIEAFSGRWLYQCFNAEYLQFPFYEQRSIAELIEFVTEERRASVFTHVIDLYSDDLERHRDGFSLESAHLDGSGYYAMTRYRDGKPLERQLDVFGGLKWRFEEYLPYMRRRIDRVSLFLAQKGLRINSDNLFNDEEYNTCTCPWHHSPTIAVCSFRTAKYLKTNPGSTFEISTFNWSKSTRFRWHSQQLMDLGMMEPGQWF